LGATEIAKRLKVGRASVYRVLADRRSPPAPAPAPATRRDALMKALSQNPQFKVLPPSDKGFIIGGQNPAQPACLRHNVVAACLAIAEEAEQAEAERHHRPSRRFGDSGADFEREILVGPLPPRPFILAGGRAEGAEGLAGVGCSVVAGMQRSRRRTLRSQIGTSRMANISTTSRTLGKGPAG
jgi:hypothetical protein